MAYPEEVQEEAPYGTYLIREEEDKTFEEGGQTGVEGDKSKEVGDQT